MPADADKAALATGAAKKKKTTQHVLTVPHHLAASQTGAKRYASAAEEPRPKLATPPQFAVVPDPKEPTGNRINIAITRKFSPKPMAVFSVDTGTWLADFRWAVHQAMADDGKANGHTDADMIFEHNGHPLPEEPTSPLDCIGVESDAVMTVRYRRTGPTITVTAVAGDGRELQLTVPTGTTMAEIIAAVHPRDPPRHLILHDGAPCRSSKSLAECGIGDGALLDVMTDCRGGMYVDSSGRQGFGPALPPRRPPSETSSTVVMTSSACDSDSASE